MCGIWASVGYSAAAAQLGLDAIANRGPDFGALKQVSELSGKVFLGHRRLSIYDLSPEAAQPMVRDDISLIFNGALYNFKEIREELRQLGHSFATQSDTEVLIEAWLQWGPTALERFDGMFALVLWDAKQNRLYAARDRFGEKPLHIYNANNSLAIASEIGQLFRAQIIANPKIDAKVAKDFLDLGIAEQGENSFFKAIKRVLPNQIQTYQITENGAKLLASDAIYPDIGTIAPLETNFAKAAQNLKHGLEKSVQARMAADVKVGSCLSGGIDSSAIVRIATQFLNGDDKLECICAVFDEKDLAGNDLSERPFALAAANHPQINLHFVSFDETRVVEAIETILERQGEPFAHSSIIAQYMVFEKAKELGIKVMLDGQGADELLGGYSGMIGHFLADVLRKKGLKQCNTEIEKLCEQPSDFNARSLKFAIFNAIIPETIRRKIAKFRGRWPSPLQFTKGEMALTPKHHQGVSLFESLILNLLQKQSLPSLLRYEDRNSMSFGIETRLPFLAKDVIEAALSTTGLLKVRDGLTKATLREAIKDYVPEIIVNRRKKLGFITPQDKWFAGALRDWAIAGVSEAKNRAPEILEFDKVDNIIAQIGTSGEINNAIFRLACFGHFMRQVNGSL